MLVIACWFGIGLLYVCCIAVRLVVGWQDACGGNWVAAYSLWSAVILLREYATAGQASEANLPLWAERSDGASAPPSALATTQHTSTQPTRSVHLRPSAPRNPKAVI